MSDFISEQEILKLLKKLDHDSQESESERMGSSSVAGINIEGQIKDGYIKVEQGKIIIGNPSNGGKIPTIEAQLPVILFVDGQEINRRMKISSESVIEWKIEEKPLFEIEVSDDKLTAYLIVHRPQRYAWVLSDNTSTLDLTLTAKEDSAIILETLNLQDILAVVENMNIKMNLDVAVIQTEIIQPTYRPVTIARGKAPVQGQDARLDICIR